MARFDHALPAQPFAPTPVYSPPVTPARPRICRSPALRVAAIMALLTAPSAHAQDEEFDSAPAIEVVERTEVLQPTTRRALDGGVEAHLGWGTLEDLFVDLGAGAQVSVLSGNLVIRVVPLPRADLPVDAMGAFTWNSGDGEGLPEVGQGWSLDLLRRVVPGAWGERILLDGDGFRDAFLVGPPPSEDEVLRIREEVVDLWRRETSARDRRALGGEDGLRVLLESDPLALAAMRLRFLGPVREPDGAQEARSSRRGTRILQELDKGWELRRPDGGTERYGEHGALVSIQAAGRGVMNLQFDHGVVVSHNLGQELIARWTWDASGRLQSLRERTGRTMEITRADRFVQRFASPAGTWRFTWDGAGRLTRFDGPDGTVLVSWRVDGTLAEARGPLGVVRLGETRAVGDTLEVHVEGPAGGPWDLRWDERGRTRELRGPGGVQVVTFDGARPLPVLVRDGGDPVELGWSGSGRLVSVESGRNSLHVGRRTSGEVVELDLGAAERLGIVRGADGRVQVRDSAGRMETLEVSGDGAVRSLALPGGLLVTARRGFQGGLLGVDLLGGQGTTHRVDPYGALRTVELDSGGTALLLRDSQGRWSGGEGPDGSRIEWRTGVGGRADTVRAGGFEWRLAYDNHGRLVGWAGAAGTTTLRRDNAGRALALDEQGRTRWAVDRDDAGRVSRLRRDDGADLQVEMAADGRILGWDRSAGGRRRFRWDGSGRVIGLDDDAEGVLDLERGRGGRVVSVRRGVGTWRLDRDGAGQIVGIQDGGGGSHRLQRDGSGRITRVVLDGLPGIDVTRDAPGRIVSLRGPDLALLIRRARSGRPEEISLTDRQGNTLNGPVSLRWDRRGALDLLIRGEDRWPVPQAAPAPTESTARHDETGRPIEVDGLRVTWGPSGWTRLGTDDVVVAAVNRDAVGRIQGFQGLDGRRWEIRHDAWGDPSRLTLVEGEVVHTLDASRDAAGRLRGLDLGGQQLTLERGMAGRIQGLRWGEGRVELGWLDDEAASDDGLALALGVPSDRPDRAPLGSRLLRVLGAGAELLAVEERWDALGRVVRARGPGGVEGGKALGAPWSGEGLGDWVGTCKEALPSPYGAGGAWDGGDAVAIPQGSGAPLTWIRRDGGILGLAMTGPDGVNRVPSGWNPPPRACPTLPVHGGFAGFLRSFLGSARVGWDSDPLAHLDASSAPWIGPRGAVLQMDGAVVPDGEEGGEGALLPPVPGARRFAPPPVGTRASDPLTILVATGDLPPDAPSLRTLLPLGGGGILLDLPAAALLLDIQARLRNPSVPPELARRPDWRFGPGLQAIALGDPSLPPLAPLVPGLPPGTRDLLPGSDGPPLPGFAVLPSEQRRTAFDALGGDPIGVGEPTLAAAEQDRILLALLALHPPGPSALSGLIQDAWAGERWVIEVAPGLRITVDGRGRPVAVDLHARTRTARAGMQLDHAGALLFGDAEGPPPFRRYLPVPTGPVEARDGLVPGDPRMPLDAAGRIQTGG